MVIVSVIVPTYNMLLVQRRRREENSKKTGQFSIYDRSVAAASGGVVKTHAGALPRVRRTNTRLHYDEDTARRSE